MDHRAPTPGERTGCTWVQSVARRVIFSLAAIGLAGAAVVSLSACGNKGPLYLPKPSEQPQAQTQQSADQQSKKQQKKQQQ
jgi:predicted small lipoprotein YifL